MNLICHFLGSLLICLYLLPFIPLSTFPHQEARFLLPLIFPLILFIVPRLIKQNLDQPVFYLWFLFNIFIAIIYGHMHQAGLLPALRYVHNSSPNAQSNAIEKLLVTYHTYMPPGYLVSSMSKSEEKIQTIIIDLKGAKREELDLTIERIFHEYSSNNTQVFLIIPVTCQTDLIDLKQKYSFHFLRQFGPHLDFDHSIDESYAGTIYQSICAIWNKYKLDLYQITRD